MTKTCCMNCITPNSECPNPPACRTEPRASWCNQKPEETSYTDTTKTNRELCQGECEKFTLKETAK